MVKNCNKLVGNYKNYLFEEMAMAMTTADAESLYLTYILETSELTSDEIVWACQKAFAADLDFLSTSTGFTSRGASIQDLKLLRKHFDDGIKIAGNVTPENFRYLLKAAAGDINGYMELDPSKIRISDTGLLNKIA